VRQQNKIVFPSYSHGPGRESYLGDVPLPPRVKENRYIRISGVP
jgi:hypothetical protein